VQSDGSIKALANVSFWVYQPGTQTPATIYAARTGVTTKANPVVTGSSGAVEFWAEMGEYDIRHVDNVSPARVADLTFGWNAIGAATAGIPKSRVNLADAIDLADLTALIESMLWKPGMLCHTAGATADTGFLLCDGAAYLRTDYPALFARLGGTNSPWGLPSGTTFSVPDLRGRTLIGPDGAAARISSLDTLGSYGGVEAVQLTAAQSGLPQHAHAITDPGHQHTPSLGGWGSVDATSAIPDIAAFIGSGPAQNSGGYLTSGNTTGITVNNVAAASASQSHTNLQPYGVCQIQIKT
jgi:microcystin-dependent protein